VGRAIHTCIVGGLPYPLGYEGENVIRTNPENTSVFWAFVHGPGIDDPVLGRHQWDINSGATYFFVTDGQGRQYVVGRADGQDGSADAEYTQHGGMLSGAGQVTRAFDVERLPDISQPGLAFFRNRFYDQQTGRWTQEDPIGVAGGLNLYGFVGNNPVTFTDPFGLCPEELKKDRDECHKWNVAEAERAKRIVEKEAAAGNPHALKVTMDVTPYNADQVATFCGAFGHPSDHACNNGSTMVLNADDGAEAMAAFMMHEEQHVFGRKTSGRGSSAAGERCATKRQTNFIQHMHDRGAASVAGSHPYIVETWNQNYPGCGF
jgi:RHS repeat-associated protein